MTITKNHLLIAAALVAAWYVLKGKGCACGGADIGELKPMQL